MTLEKLESLIRDVPDFPKPGILFKDITPLLADAEGFAGVTRELCARIEPVRPDAIVGIESRGFIFGAAVAATMKLPLELVRKSGKLPYQTVSQSYDLEYGTDTVEMHVDAIHSGKRYVVVDDLIATGGTARATCDLIAKQGGEIALCLFVIELAFLSGRETLGPWPVDSLLTY